MHCTILFDGALCSSCFLLPVFALFFPSEFIYIPDSLEGGARMRDCIWIAESSYELTSANAKNVCELRWIPAARCYHYYTRVVCDA